MSDRFSGMAADASLPIQFHRAPAQRARDAEE